MKDDQDIEPLPGDAAGLLASEARRPDIDAALRSRVARRLEQSLRIEAWDAIPAPRRLPEAPARRAARGRVAFAAAALLVGGVAGAAVHALVRPGGGAPAGEAPGAVAPPSPPTLATSLAPPAIPPSATVAPSSTPRASAAPPPRAAPFPPAPSGLVSGSTPARASPPGLAEESALLEQARRATAARQSRTALSLLDEHARAFPRGHLAEERECLRVQALVAAGRRDEARARADDFFRQFPASFFRSTVERALRENEDTDSGAPLQ